MTAPVFTALPPDVLAELEEALAELHAHGYKTVESHGNLRAGTRVRNRGQQYPKAYQEGTGNVWAVTLKDPSSWSQTWRMPDVELLVVVDEASFGSRVSKVAQYHVEAVEVER